MTKMSWFDAAGFANLAKSALKEAQKTIDKALDIKDEEDGGLKQSKLIISILDADVLCFSIKDIKLYKILSHHFILISRYNCFSGIYDVFSYVCTYV